MKSTLQLISRQYIQHKQEFHIKSQRAAPKGKTKTRPPPRDSHAITRAGQHKKGNSPGNKPHQKRAEINNGTKTNSSYTFHTYNFGATLGFRLEKWLPGRAGLRSPPSRQRIPYCPISGYTDLQNRNQGKKMPQTNNTGHTYS